jgi:hypothetical protein
LDHFDTVVHRPTNERYSIGDGVLISRKAIKALSMTSPMLVPERPLAASKRKGKSEIQDGLDHYDLLGILIDLWKDEADRAMMKVHWLYRPRVALHVWGDYETEDVAILPNELFYATDPYYHDEYHAHMYRDGALPTAFKHKHTKAQDDMPVSLLVRRVPLVASAEEAADVDGAFVVQRFWNPLPDEDEEEEFLQEFDFDAVRTWGRGSGWWELQKRPEAAQPKTVKTAKGKKRGKKGQEDVFGSKAVQPKKAPAKKEKAKAVVQEDSESEQEQASESGESENGDVRPLHRVTTGLTWREELREGRHLIQQQRERRRRLGRLPRRRGLRQRGGGRPRGRRVRGQARRDPAEAQRQAADRAHVPA